MSNAPLTPIDDAEPTSPVIDYSPATVAYDETFENNLMRAILYPSSHTPAQNPMSPPPHIQPTTLPVPLNSPLRTYPSSVPGVYLTHENGYHTGGPGPAPATVSEFAAKFIAEHDIQDAGQLERVVEEEIKKRMEEVRERMRDREEKVQWNESIRKKIEDLDVQRSAEKRVADRIKEEKMRRRTGG